MPRSNFINIIDMELAGFIGYRTNPFQDEVGKKNKKSIMSLFQKLLFFRGYCLMGIKYYANKYNINIIR